MFLLNADESWSKSDIDFYAPYGLPCWNGTHVNNAETFFYDVQGWKNTHTGLYMQFCGEIATVRDYHPSRLDLATQTSQPGSFISTRFEKFQVITIQDKRPRGIYQTSIPSDFSRHSVREFIVNTFDFNVLMNIFYYDENGPQVEIGDLKSILEMAVQFDPNAYLKKFEHISSSGLYNRIKKYKKRGFKFVGPEWDENRYPPEVKPWYL